MSMQDLNQINDCCAAGRADAGSTAPQPGAAGASGDRAAQMSSFGAVGAAAFSSACCWLPLLLLAFGLSAGGVAGMFEQVRPYFLIAAALLLGSGFYFAYFRSVACKPGKACATPNPKVQRFNRVMLWVAAVFAIGFGTFPYYSPALVRAFDAGFAASTDEHTSAAITTEVSTTWQFDIEGMTCTGCAAVLEARLKRVPGVDLASVSYTEKSARIVVADDHDDSAAVQHIIDATRDAGFIAKVTE